MNSQTLINDKKNLEPYDFLFSSEIKKNQTTTVKDVFAFPMQILSLLLKEKNPKSVKSI